MPVQLTNWHWHAIIVSRDESSLHLVSKAVKVFFASGQINKLDTRGSQFTCVSNCQRNQRFSLLFSLTLTHSEGLATGVQPCSTVETKHWSVLTECDPCFRPECCQRQIDGSHPEEDVYRKILLAEICLLFYIRIETQGRSHGCAKAKCSPSDNEGNLAVHIIIHTSLYFWELHL